MDDSLLEEEQQAHAYVFNYFHLLGLFEAGICKARGIILKVEFAVGEGLDGIVAIVLGKEGTYLIPHVVEEVKFVFEGRFYSFLISFLLDELLILFEVLLDVLVLVDGLMNAQLRNEAINS